ncbi:MAG: carbon-nitrogen hydrolase [Candidatus Paceibacterota bacterium]
MKNKIVTIAGVQTTAGVNIKENVLKNIALVKKAAESGAQIVCLQELFNTVYFPQRVGVAKDQFAEEIKGETVELFKNLAKELKIVIIVPIYEKAKNKSGKWEYHNSAVVIDEKGKLLPIYRKVHIPHDPGFYEKEYFKESDFGYKIYKTKYATFAVLICFDQWFPEAARAVRLLGAEIIFYPTAIGNVLGYSDGDDWHDAWETIQRSHAIANSLYVMAVNRVGVEDKMEFFGQSFVADPFGKVLNRASKNKEEILVADVDLARNTFVAEDWGFLRNRRPETYEVLTSKKAKSKFSKKTSAEAHGKIKKSLK